MRQIVTKKQVHNFVANTNSKQPNKHSVKMNVLNLFALLVFAAYSVISEPLEHHGSTRGGNYESHRSLQRFRPFDWTLSETVCRRTGSGQNRKYTTRKMIAGLWRVYEWIGIARGVKGACEDVCPCGDAGNCMSLPGDRMSDSTDVATTYQCSCSDGSIMNGSGCTTVRDEPQSCGGFTGTACSDDTLICIDDPSDDCDPAKGGADCIGICVSSCGGFTPAPQPGCPDGTICIDNPNTPDCLLAADCPGVCSPLPLCKLSDGSGCPDGYSCTIDEAVACDNNLDCPGKCAQTCAGFTEAPQAPCSQGTYCVDNPATPDCLIAADCTGVCLPPPKCSTKDSTGCWEGFSCTLDPNTACIALEGFDCPGICAPTCAGLTAEPQAPCPDGTSCVDNPATPDCLIAADCTGVCLPPPSCIVSTGEGCNDGFACTYDPNIACIALVGVECPGICVPACAGGRANNVECPSGLYCVDNPATPNCLIAADCTGVCLPPSQCDIKSGEGCLEGYSCTVDSSVACFAAEGCPGICAPTCGGSVFPNAECPNGTKCVDNPATPDCTIAADCTGVCLVPSD